MNILNIQMKKIEKLTQPQSFWGNSLQSRWVKENDSWLLLWVCFAQAVEDFGWAFKVRTRSGRDHPRVTCLQCLVKTVKMYPEIIHGMDFDSRCPSLTNMFTTLFTMLNLQWGPLQHEFGEHHAFFIVFTEGLWTFWVCCGQRCCRAEWNLEASELKLVYLQQGTVVVSHGWKHVFFCGNVLFFISLYFQYFRYVAVHLTSFNAALMALMAC